MARYKRPVQNTVDPYKSQPLPLGRPVAVYYRQSTEGQIGNISTTLQTVDMVEHLIRQGWTRDQVIMIDMDAGVSGTKKIHERPGMSRLYNMIENGEIGIAAAQDVDRFFRDLTQIETNIFIDVCRRNNVQVLTPSFVYDFAHPTQGRYHMQMFRERAQQAADFIEFHIKGRLLTSRSYMSDQGLWVGSTTGLGYLVDDRKRVQGEKNPNWRKLVPFPPHADVVLAYFKLFKTYNGNLKQTWEHIEAHGPFIPEFAEEDIPEGFKLYLSIRTRSRITDKLMPSKDGLRDMFQNVRYIGHWSHRNVIVQRFNHEGIVPLDLFMYAFNRMSPTDFNGDPNPDYIRYRPFNRYDRETRPVEPPAYVGLLFSADMPNYGVRRYSASYDHNRQVYNYLLSDPYNKKVFYSVTADSIDGAIDKMFIQRLQATTVDEGAWQAAVESTQQGDFLHAKRLKQSLRNTEQAQRYILQNLKSLSHPELIKNLQDEYIVNQQEIQRLQQELDQFDHTQQYKQILLEARPVIDRIISNWNAVPRDKRRELFEAFAGQVMIQKLDLIRYRITVTWRDGTETTKVIQSKGGYFSWTPTQLQQLKTMVESHIDQVEILKTFDGASWRSIQQRYAYHFGNGRWIENYQGNIQYQRYTRWQDTTEFLATQDGAKACIGERPISKRCKRRDAPSAPSRPPQRVKRR